MSNTTVQPSTHVPRVSVAIPILLCHTLLSRHTENIIAQMEEKAVAFTNIVYKTRSGSGEE